MADLIVKICIFMGCVWVYVIFLTFLGPENRGRSMEARDDEDLVEVAGYREGIESDVEKV
jgi:SHS family lactate transporter-like MFS transporter